MSVCHALNHQCEYTSQRQICVDEVMVAFKGRLHFKQHIAMKPNKRGIKVWALCESLNIYTVKSDHG